MRIVEKGRERRRGKEGRSVERKEAEGRGAEGRRRHRDSSAVLCICLPPFIFPITVKITVYTADSTAKTRFTE